MPRRQRTKLRTFQQIMIQVEGTNSMRLMERAKTANRLAKCVGGRARHAAYRVKVDSLLTLNAHFPERVRIHTDPRLRQFVVVSVPAAKFGLHAPAHYFQERAVL